MSQPRLVIFAKWSLFLQFKHDRGSILEISVFETTLNSIVREGDVQALVEITAVEAGLSLAFHHKTSLGGGGKGNLQRTKALLIFMLGDCSRGFSLKLLLLKR